MPSPASILIFSLTPPPRADVRVCADMSCHLRGGGGSESGAGAGLPRQQPGGRFHSRCLLPRSLRPGRRRSRSMIGFIADCTATRRPPPSRTCCSRPPLPPEPARDRPPNAGDLRSLLWLLELFRGAEVCGDPRLERHCRHPESQRPARDGRGRLPYWQQVGDRAQRPRQREIHCLQCRRERTGHHQGPLHHGSSPPAGD